jgi:hypothetical protein
MGPGAPVPGPSHRPGRERHQGTPVSRTKLTVRGGTGLASGGPVLGPAPEERPPPPRWRLTAPDEIKIATRVEAWLPGRTRRACAALAS